MREEALNLYQELLEDSYHTVKLAKAGWGRRLVEMAKKPFQRTRDPITEDVRGMEGALESQEPWVRGLIRDRRELENAGYMKNLGLITSGAAIPATGFYAHRKGREQGQEEASSNKMLTFGGGMAVGAAVPKAIELASDYAEKVMRPQHPDPFQRF